MSESIFAELLRAKGFMEWDEVDELSEKLKDVPLPPTPLLGAIGGESGAPNLLFVIDETGELWMGRSDTADVSSIPFEDYWTYHELHHPKRDQIN